MLRALLGAPLTMSACRRAPAYDYDGDFVAEHRAVGHAFRDGKLPVGSGELSRSANVLILGAGAAGLVAGWRLRREGVDDIAVLDLADAPGGTAVGGRSGVTGYPWGAHYLPAPTSSQPGLVELLDEMGFVVGYDDAGTPTYDEGELCAAPQERVFYKGRWYAGLLPEAAFGADDRRQLAAFRRRVDEWIAFRDGDGRRAFTIPVAACSDAPAVRRLDERSMADWLDGHRFDSPLVRAAVDYACRDDFGAAPSEVSAWYGLHYFAARTPKPGADSAPFLTWPEGNARLMNHLAARIGLSRLHVQTVVTGVRRTDDAGLRWAVSSFDIATGQARQWRARHVVCALPSFMRQRLFASGSVPGYAPTYGAWMVANLHLRGRPQYLGFETAWDNVIFDSRSLGYVVATHQQGSAHGPTVWTWYLPLVDADAKKDRRRLEGLSWAEAAGAAVHDLAHAHEGLPRQLSRVDVRRWGHAMVRPEPGLAFSKARLTAARSADGLHFAHSDLSGVALFEEAFHHGDRAARAVLAEREKST